jgi:hypothetical protein
VNRTADNLWIKKVIESCFLSCAIKSILAKGGHEVRGTSARERIRTQKPYRALRSAMTGGCTSSGMADRATYGAWLVRARHRGVEKKALLSRAMLANHRKVNERRKRGHGPNPRGGVSLHGVHRISRR